MLAAQAHVQAGRQVVVDVDLEKFFNRVNHDILIDRLSKRIDDVGVIRLIRAYLNSGIMGAGVVQQRYCGHAARRAAVAAAGQRAARRGGQGVGAQGPPLRALR